MLDKKKHPRTINKVLTVFKTILNDAVKSNHLLKNPIKGYSELREPLERFCFGRRMIVSSFLNYTRLDPFHDLYVTTLNTGMRLGEILGLCWDKIDFENNQIVVSRCLGRSGLKETTKTHEPRFIPMNMNVRAILEKLSKSKINDSFVFCKSDLVGADASEVAEVHLENKLGLCSYETAIHGGEMPQYDCPECSKNTLVPEDESYKYFICVNCSEKIDSDNLHTCSRCSTIFYDTNEEPGSACHDYWDDLMNKD